MDSEEENENAEEQNFAESLDSSADEAKQLVDQIFDPTQREEAYLQEVDQEIVNIDVPERIQMGYYKSNRQVLRNYREAASEDEIKWVFERVQTERTFHLTAKEKEQFFHAIKLILDVHRT